MEEKNYPSALTSDPSNPQTVDSHALDHVLEQYYLNSDTPTIDYIYSLAALGAKDPNELQPLLEADTIEDLN